MQHREGLDLAAILGKQASILERDRRLCRKALQSVHVVVRERTCPVSESVHGKHAEHLVTDEQRLRDRRTKPDGDELGKRVGGRRIVVDAERLSQLGGSPDEPASERDVDITEGAAVHPRTRHELVLGVEQVDGTIAAEQRAGMVDDQPEQTVELQLRSQFPLDHRERFSLRHQPSVSCFHLRDDGQRHGVHQNGRHARRQRGQDEEGGSRTELEHVAGAGSAEPDHDGDEEGHEPEPAT